MVNVTYAVWQGARLERAVGAVGSAPAGAAAASQIREVTAPSFACGQGTGMPFAESTWVRLRSEGIALTPRQTERHNADLRTANTKQDVFQGHRAWGPPM